MRNLKLISIGLLPFLISCSEELNLENFRWSQPSKSPPYKMNLEARSVELRAGSKSIIFEKQYINQAEVEDSFYKRITGSQVEFISSNWIYDIPIATRIKIFYMKAQIPILEKRFRNIYAQYKEFNLYEKPRVIIRNEKIRWNFILESKIGQLLGVYLDDQFKITEVRKLGSEFQSSTAKLFPQGPLKSSLQEVLLQDLSGNTTLSTPQMRVISQSHEKAYSEDSQFFYPVNDRRFEQVQVYYYISKMLNWCKSELSFTIPFFLDVETSIGYPEKTNTAFYYRQKIRLGDGDDVVFSHIALDPSVVIHESFHAVIEAVSRLPYQNEGGSLNEGFADFFTAVLLESPIMGEVSYKKAPFKRTVQNNLGLGSKSGNLYSDSGIISGLFWSFYSELGKETGIKIAWEVLLRMSPQSNFKDFEFELNEILKNLTIQDQLSAREIMKNRGWVY